MYCMKKSLFFPVMLVFSLFLISCEEENLQLITFEEVALTDSVWTGSNAAGRFTVSGFNFENTFTQFDWGSSWKGFACSEKIDTQTAGYTNEYSVIAGVGAAKSAKFAVVYDTATVICNASVKLSSMMLTNNTYAYLDMENGSLFTKKFAANDWFKVTITGYKNKIKTTSVDYYLADFRDGKTFISNSWNKVDVSTLGEVDMFSFAFDSSDKGEWGVNTPKYVCIDNIAYSELEVAAK
jgi:hypothetical protein